MKVPLRTLLIGPFLVQVIGITGLVGYLSYRSGQRALETTTEQLMTATSEQVRAGLEAYLQVPQFVNATNRQLIRAGQFSSTQLAPLEPHFMEQLRLFPQLSEVAMTNTAGAFLKVHRLEDGSFMMHRLNVNTTDGLVYRYRTDVKGQNLTLLDRPQPVVDPHHDPPGNPWSTAARRTPDGFWRLVVSLQGGDHQPLLTMVRFVPVYSAAGQWEGVISAGILLTHLESVLQRLTPGQYGQLFLVEPNGDLIATSTGEIPFQPQGNPNDTDNVAVQPRRLSATASRNGLTRAATQSILAHQSSFTSTLTPQFLKLRWQGKSYYVRVTAMPGDLNWRLVTVLPKADVMADVQANGMRTVLLCALTLLGTIGLGVWTAESIVKPIVSLNQATQAITEGITWVPPTQPSPIQELETLRQGFEQMVKQLVISFRALRDRENTLITFLNVMPIAICVHDPSGQMLFLNQKGHQLLVQGVTTVPSDRFSEAYAFYVAGTDQLYPIEQLPVVKGLQGETAYTDDIEIDVGGQRIPVEVHTIPVFDSLGRVLYVINAFQDITERRQAEQLRTNYERELEQRVAEQTASLAQGEVTKQALINAIPDLLMRLGRDGIPREIYNLDAIHWLGNKATAYQDTIYENLPIEIAAERQRCVEVALATGQIQRQAYEFSCQGQTYCEEARIIPVTQDEVLVVVRDISDLRKVERLKDEFIAIVSHELRTPLTAIRGALGILNSGVLHDRPEKAQGLLTMSLVNTERLIRLVNDILDLERLTSGQVPLVKQPCQVAELMQSALESVKALALDSDISLELTALDAVVWAAPDAIVQTLTNLLSNAIKFSAAGSRVWLRAEIQTVEEGAGQEATMDSPMQPPLPSPILFSVTDQGRGIPVDHLESIFERFQQVDRSDSRQKGGTGLGLAICKSIVTQHGGKIWVESIVGKGSTFYFTLPIKSA